MEVRHSAAMSSGLPSKPTIVYDGNCPFCSKYVQMLRLQKVLGQVQLIDAREGPSATEVVTVSGFDLDKGMALILEGKVYHGADCVHRLALLTIPSDFFNRLVSTILSNSRTAALIYPIMRASRNATLWILGRRPPAAKKTMTGLTWNSYLFWTTALTVSIMIYLVLAQTRGSIPFVGKRASFGHGELFPFFNWSLFSASRRTAKRYSIEILQARKGSRAEHFEGKLLLSHELNLLRSIRFQKLASQLYSGRDELPDAEEFKNTKRLIDNFARAEGIIRYRIALLTFDPFSPLVSTNIAWRSRELNAGRFSETDR